MGRLRAVAVTITLLLVFASPARADLTGFIGINTVPSNRQAWGIAMDLSLIGVGLEIEYCNTSQDQSQAAPELTTVMANLLLESPIRFYRMQPYVVGGGGVYRETLGDRENRDAGYDLGGGVKVTLLGPLQLRADYRWIKLGSGALDSPAHRFYVGVVLPF